MKLLFTLIFFLSSLIARSDEPVEITPWMGFREYCVWFDENCQGSRSTWTAYVEGRETEDGQEYRAVHAPRNGLHYWTHIGMTDASFEERDGRYKADGFFLLCDQIFEDGDGNSRHQAVWVRSPNYQKADLADDESARVQGMRARIDELEGLLSKILKEKRPAGGGSKQ